MLEDVPAGATGVVGECTGAGALRLPGSPAPAVLVMYCRRRGFSIDHILPPDCGVPTARF